MFSILPFSPLADSLDAEVFASRTKTIVKIIAVLAAAYHALASAAADRASHWAAMPNHQPSCFARSKLPGFARSKLPCDQVWHIMPVELGVAQLTDDIDC